MNAIDIAPFSSFREKIQALGKKTAVVTDERLRSFAEKLLLPIWIVPSGEACKTRREKERIEDFLQQEGFGRDSCLVALGGGSIGDLVGFTAATYCRGIDFVNIPTTLLAMVDACLGDKKAINTPFGKNTIGAHWPSRLILIDPQFTEMLPSLVIACGAMEMVKHGLIADAGYFDRIEQGADVRSAQLIEESLQIKRRLCTADPQERAERLLLNFGHTVGHALETHSGYTMPHGIAVGIGLKIEAFISYRKGWLAEADLRRIQRLVDQFISWPFEVDSKALVNLMKRDKKALKGVIRMSALQTIGEPKIFEGNFCSFFEDEFLERTIAEALKALF